jgi:hypothetical protein
VREVIAIIKGRIVVVRDVLGLHVLPLLGHDL